MEGGFSPQTPSSSKDTTYWHHSTHAWGNCWSLPPEEILAGRSAAIFNLIQNDSFGTNSEDNFSFVRFFLARHLVKHHTIFGQLLAHLKIPNHGRNLKKKSLQDKINIYNKKINQICWLCYLKELKLRLLGKHLGVVGVKPSQLSLNVRQGTFLHDTLGDILVRAEVVPPIHLKTTPDNLLMHLRINPNSILVDFVSPKSQN